MDKDRFLRRFLIKNYNNNFTNLKNHTVIKSNIYFDYENAKYIEDVNKGVKIYYNYIFRKEIEVTSPRGTFWIKNNRKKNIEKQDIIRVLYNSASKVFQNQNELLDYYDNYRNDFEELRWAVDDLHCARTSIMNMWRNLKKTKEE